MPWSRSSRRRTPCARSTARLVGVLRDEDRLLAHGPTRCGSSSCPATARRRRDFVPAPPGRARRSSGTDVRVTLGGSCRTASRRTRRSSGSRRAARSTTCPGEDPPPRSPGHSKMPRSPRGGAAVDRPLRAGDVAGLVGGEEHDHVGDLVGLCPSGRAAGSWPSRTRRRRRSSVIGRVDAAGWTEFTRMPRGRGRWRRSSSARAPPTCSTRRRRAGQADDAGGRRDVDDRAAAGLAHRRATVFMPRNVPTRLTSSIGRKSVDVDLGDRARSRGCRRCSRAR